MVCTNCGAEMDRDGLFCSNCGTKHSNNKEMNETENQAIESSNEEVTQNVNQDNVRVEIPNEVSIERMKEKSSKRKYIFAIVGVCVFFLFAVLIWKLIPRTIDLNEYLTVEFEGYETVGEAKVYINEAAFKLDYGNKIKFVSDDAYLVHNNLYSSNGTQAVDGFLNAINVYVEENGMLSTGDTVKIKWECDEERIGYFFNYGVEYEEVEYDVEGLEQLDYIDLFEKFEVRFSGYSPRINVTYGLNDSKELYNSLIYETLSTEFLTENEEIRFNVKTTNGEDINTYLARYGYKTGESEKKYIVSGDGHYVSDINEIPSTDFEELKQDGLDAVYAYNTKTLDSYMHTTFETDISYVDSYFLVAKDVSQVADNNLLYMVYEVCNTITTQDIWDVDFTETFTHYITVQYDDMVCTSSGDYFIEGEYYYFPKDKVKLVINFMNKKNSPNRTYHLYGYETFEEVFQNVVVPMVNDYNYMQ